MLISWLSCALSTRSLFFQHSLTQLLQFAHYIQIPCCALKSLQENLQQAAGGDAFTAPCWGSGQWKFHFSVNPHIPSGQGGSCWAPALLGRVGLDYFSRAGWFSACATGFLHFWQAQVSQRLSNSLCAPCKTLPCCPERGLKPGTRGATPNPESKDIYLRPRVKHQLITQCFCNLFLDINAWV